MAQPISLDNIRLAPWIWGQARLRLLRQRDITLTEIARRTGKDLAWVSRINSGLKRDPAVERALAQALGLSLREAFPEHGRRASREVA